MLNKVSSSLAALVAMAGASASALIDAATVLGRNDDKSPRIRHVRRTVVPYGKRASNLGANRKRQLKREIGARQVRRLAPRYALKALKDAA